LATPLTLEADHNDVMAARDSGLLQIHCATCQEVLDATLIAYRIAEDARVRLPVIVNLDGFYLSFTREPVSIPEPDEVLRFLPDFDAGSIRFRAGQPISQAVAVLGGEPYSYFRYETHLAANAALEVHREVVLDFEAIFGRRYDAVETYRSKDAEIVFLMIGSFSTKARAAVDALREAGERVGLVRPRLLRPYPVEDLQRALAGKRGVAVIDQNLSPGRGGALHSELAAALYGADGAPGILASFIGGLGGRDISPAEFYEIASVTRKAADEGITPEPQLLFQEAELREVRKLQAIASQERDRIGSSHEQ
jgi:pyruvate ferredoxin oxidoreductase alpha subunit